MPTEAEHLQQARLNRDFLAKIDDGTAPQWVATVSFYVAVHLVEALFARHGKSTFNHVRRNNQLRRDHLDIWKDYRPLYTFSRLARYRCKAVDADGVAYVLRRLGRVEREVLRALNLPALPAS